eukprot:jgi/Botrbrau1/6455/Bobra.0034s0030.1
MLCNCHILRYLLLKRTWAARGVRGPWGFRQLARCLRCSPRLPPNPPFWASNLWETSAGFKILVQPLQLPKTKPNARAVSQEECTWDISAGLREV